jgi:cytoskeletal protein CcmA (bactofilin family)
MFRGPAASARPSENNESATESVLGRGARVRGRIGGDGDLRVEGQVEGEVRITGQLSIEEGGSVTGDVEAAGVVIGGALTGDVTGGGAVTIRAGAKVVGNVGGELVLEEGASFEGRVDAVFDLPGELGPQAAPNPGRPRRP